MKILAVDTASNTCSVALADNGMLKVEYSADHGRTHAVELGGMIDDVLRASGTAVSDIEAFAVTTGPGSFTGLRIGISTVKGLSYAVSRPVAPVSTLDALAFQCAGVETLICSLIDARKKEVYAAIYRWRGEQLETVSKPFVADPGQALAEIREKCFFVGTGALLYRELIEAQLGKLARVAPGEMSFVRASTVARLGGMALSENGGVSAHEILPFYIRRSDAEKSTTSYLEKSRLF
jgi:tRNA threonylcarbamoyladenosine biosynthesis protein TsaB